MSEADVSGQSRASDTAAATSAADWKPWRVACVTWQEDQTASANASESAVDTAIPIGVTRIAAPFVVPKPPTVSGSSPARTRSSAAFVEGPSRSSDPRSIMESSQDSSAWEKSPASSATRPEEEPPPRTRRDAISSACSVSSVTEPAGIPGAYGWESSPSTSPVTRPYTARICSGDIACVGIPNASPNASPANAPYARDKRGSMMHLQRGQRGPHSTNAPGNRGAQ